MLPKPLNRQFSRRDSFSRRWFPASALSLGGHSLLLEWLTEAGSLTARLKSLSSNNLTVEILSQRWARAEASEARALGLPLRAMVLIREVILKGNGDDWVFARSILPRSSLTGSLRCLSRLDNRPLGGWLFRQPSLRRGPMMISPFAHGDLRLELITPRLDHKAENRTLWGRRSVFYVQSKPLLVAELFLPDFMARIERGPKSNRNCLLIKP